MTRSLRLLPLSLQLLQGARAAAALVAALLLPLVVQALREAQLSGQPLRQQARKSQEQRRQAAWHQALQSS